MKRSLFLVYGVLAYLAFFGTILYAIGFVGNLFVPKAIDGPVQVPLANAILIDSSLLLLFALQHSIMARPGFKKWWTRLVPTPIERSTFVLLASLCLMLMMWQWQPIGGIIWSVQNETAKTILIAIYLVGWAIVFISTFLINHFDLFGLRQTWFSFRGTPYSPLPFRIPLFYRFVRHPLYLGFLVAFWSTPVMTAAHLLFAILTTAYIFTAIKLEEKDLLTHFGDKYSSYKRWVPKIIPFTRKNANKETTYEDAA